MKTTSTRSTDILFFALVFICLLIASLFGSGRVHGQTTTQVFKVKRWYDADSIVTSTVKKDTVFIEKIVYVYDTIRINCDSVVVPPVATELHSMYVVLDDVIGDTDGFLKYATDNGVNELNLYARAYITSTSRNSKLAAFISKAHSKGMKCNVDYRLTSEIPFWQTYFNTYTSKADRPDGMITEREPYVTGDYTGFYPFLLQGDEFASKVGIGLYCYMGHPTQQAWDSIIVHCDRVYLSNYISMSVYASADGQYRYVAGRWQYITNSAKKAGKVDYPVVYIKSLERKIWGAANDFMGLAYVGGFFYGSILTSGVAQYNINASAEIKTYTNLIGDCIFHYKYGVLAIPKK